MRSPWSTLVLGSGLVVAVAACSNDSTGVKPPNGTCSGTTFSLASLEGRVIPAEDLPCLTIAADGGTYVVVPQFPTASATLAPVDFTLTAGTGSATARVVPMAQRVPPVTALRPDLGRAQRTLDGYLRRQERQLAAAARSAPPSARGPLANRVEAQVVLPTTKIFHVLSDFSNNNTFQTDTANLKYTGTHIAIYQSQNAPAPPNGFTDAQIAAFGNTFDQDLYQIDVQTFGAATDIDNNGHVIVLMSPIINHLTTANTCNTQGFIAGFFDAIDLLPISQYPNSNTGEIFYSLVPDPQGTFSCSHSIAATGELTTSTFIHEFQHMISFGQHAILRGGNEEDSWLNEGLSHVAEELGSRYYENKFPPPSGRTDADQVFPDSSQGFISGDLYNSWHFLFAPTSTDTTDKASVSNWGNGDGTLVQRGGAWLFLRWLGDQEDSTVYGRLDQTALTGVPNVEAASSSTFQTLFGEFSLALYVDSLPGVARASIPSEFRFTSRNLRALYGKEHERNPDTFTITFPIEATPLAPGSSRSSSMYPGTMDFYVLSAPSSGNSVVLTFAPASGSTFNASLHAQVSVFHCPSAAACPSSVH